MTFVSDNRDYDANIATKTYICSIKETFFNDL